MPFQIIRNDITRVSADAVVNTANPQVAVGAGVDRAIYEAAGVKELLRERAKIGPMEPGQAAVTPAFGLDAKYIIHTVGPVWRGGNFGEREAVASCYRNSLDLARKKGCDSIAFPLISTGTYGFPKDEALQIAVREISSFLFEYDMTVYMVVYDRESFVISGKAFSDIRAYIEEMDVLLPSEPKAVVAARRARKSLSSQRWREPKETNLPENIVGSFLMEEDEFGEPEVMASESFDAAGDEELDEILKKSEETFQQRLFRLIDRRDLSDPQVYKKANMDRKLFSKIRSNPDYVPSKRTALALAVALELNLDETADLLGRAGLALSPSSRFDLIVGYCISHGIYNIFDINTYLFEYNEPLLAG